MKEKSSLFSKKHSLWLTSFPFLYVTGKQLHIIVLVSAGIVSNSEALVDIYIFIR